MYFGWKIVIRDFNYVKIVIMHKEYKYSFKNDKLEQIDY